MKTIRPPAPAVTPRLVLAVLAGMALATVVVGQKPAAATNSTPNAIPPPPSEGTRPATPFTGTIPLPGQPTKPTDADAAANAALPFPVGAVPPAAAPGTTPGVNPDPTATLPVPSTATTPANPNAATPNPAVPNPTTPNPALQTAVPTTPRPLALPGTFPKSAAGQTARPNVPTVPGVARPVTSVPQRAGVTPVVGAPGAPGTVNTADTEENNALLERLKNVTDLDDDVSAIKLKGMPLDQFLDIYSKAAKRIVLRGQGLNGQLQVTFVADKKLPREVILQAFDTVLALNQIATIPQGEEFVLVVPSQTASSMGKTFTTNGPAGYNEAFQYVTHIVQVKHADVKEAVEVMAKFASAQNAQGIVALESTKTMLPDYQANVKRMLEVLEKIDVLVEDDYQLEVIPIKYGKVEEIYATLSSVIGGGGGGASALGLGRQSPAANRRNTTRSSSARSSGSYGNGGYGGYGGGGGGGYNYNSFDPQPLGPNNSFEPQQASVTPIGAAARAGTGFQQRLSGVNRAGGPAGAAGAFAQLLETTTITPDERSNSLIVYGTKKDIAKLKEVIAKVDTLLAQVMIEGIIMEVSLTDGLNFGLSGGQQPKNFGGDPNIRGGGSINGDNSLNNVASFLTGNGGTNGVFSTGGGLSYLTRIGGRWDVTLNAIASDGRVNIIQQPRIQTTHATEARFFVGSTVAFQQGSYYGVGVGGGNAYYQRQDVGIDLTVTPYITPDGLVTMEVQQVIEEIAPGASTDSAIPPTTNKREASSTVSVMSGESILLGGYIRNAKSDGHSGVPVLKDIPVIGKLFSSNSRNTARTELLVLVHPTVLLNPKEAAEMATHSRADSASLRQLDYEIKTAEEARKTAIEKNEKKRGNKWWR